MSERLAQIEQREQEPQEWQLLSEMPQRDYWVGADYNDMYRNRLQLNVPRFESICRQLNLPPLEITSIPYTPPAEEYPEMVSRGLAAWKKAAFGRPRSSNDPNAPFDVMSMPEIAVIGVQAGTQMGMIPIPLGWRLGLRTRKIERDIARSGYELAKDEEEQLFVEGFNDALWQGIQRIQSHEWSDTRALGMQSNYAKNSISLALTSITTPLSPTILELLSGLDLSLSQSVGTMIGTASGMQVISSEAVRMWLERNADKTLDPKMRERLSMIISNSWRADMFPERFEQETHGMSKWTERSIRGLPYVGLMMEKDLKYGIVKKQHSKPLVRLVE